MKRYSETQAPTSSPWGPIQQLEKLGPGWYRVETASHGGMLLSPERVNDINPAWLDASFSGNGWRGMFEEDIDWCIPVLAFEEEYRAYAKADGDDDEWIDRIVGSAQETLDHWLLKQTDDESRSYGPAGAAA